MTCPKEDVLIALMDGELGESQARSVRAHAEGCTRCTNELATVKSIAADLGAEVPGALGKDVEAFADDVLGALDRPRAAPKARWSTTRWALLLAAAIAIPLAVMAVRSSRPEEWASRGVASRASTTLFRFGRVVETSFEPITEGTVVAPDALLAAEVGQTEGAPRFLLAFMIDAAGERHWIYPVYEPGAAPPSAIALPVTQPPRVLGSMVRLDHPAKGAARLVAIVLPRSETVEWVEKAPLESLTREGLLARYAGSLVIVTHVEVRP